MSKRFTDTDKWRDPWYRKLSPCAKLLWQWLQDNCDNAGVIEPDWELAEFQIGENRKGAKAELGNRIQEIEGGKLWLPGFVEFQYGTLSEECRAHGPALKSLEKHGLLDRVFKGYPKGIHTLVVKDKVKDKTKAKDTERDLPHSEKFAEAWKRWGKHRSEIKKPLKPTQIGAQLKKLAAMTEAAAVTMIDHTITNGWQGLREPESPQSRNGTPKLNRNDGTANQAGGAIATAWRPPGV